MPYPIPLSTGHSIKKNKKIKKPNPELREDDPPRFTEKTRSLALAAMAREREREREERGLVRWLAVEPWQWVRPWWLGDGVHVHHGFGSEEKRTNKREQDERENEKGRESRIRDNIILIFNYTILLQYRPKNRMVL